MPPTRVHPSAATQHATQRNVAPPPLVAAMLFAYPHLSPEEAMEAAWLEAELYRELVEVAAANGCTVADVEEWLERQA